MIRGDVYWAELVPRSGSEQSGKRPVVIVSRDAFNANGSWMSVNVVPLTTSTSRTHRGPTVVLVPQTMGGMARDSVALCHQVTTLDRRKLSKRITTLSASVLKSIDVGLRAALSLD
jgi:mRNA interferase MazF